MMPFDVIATDGQITSAIYYSQDVAEVNLLKRAILNEIETYAIDIVSFDINTLARHDEILALRFGQLVIDNSQFVPPENEDFRSQIDFSGPGEFNTDHIPGIPFAYKTPIAILKKDQRIKCEVIVKKGQGATHVKWRPISTFTFSPITEGYKITISGVGMLTGDEIIKRGYDKIRDAARREPITLFWRPLIPKNLVL